MKNLIILIILIFSHQSFSQILPSYHGFHHKKQSQSQSQSDYFDDSNKGNYIVISGNSVTSSYGDGSYYSHSWNTVYGSEGISSGIKEWQLTIDSYVNTYNSWDIVIGIAHTKNNGETALNSFCRGHGYISELGAKTKIDDCGHSESYGLAYGEGDVIKIQLNMNNGELIFFKNGISQGVSRIVDTSLTWYLAISIGNSGTSVSITG